MDYIDEDEDDNEDEEDVEAHDPIDQWCWLAYAVWSRASSTLFQHVDVAFKSLMMRDVDAIEAVLKCSYPKLVNGLNKPSDQYGFVDLPKELRFNRSD
ncbi:hypothetical protein PHYPSEUDO_009984 [Phytophthora pseudosyringae]|uniref:Uncharacterized protein n=1 Tax=Phytophthora pseudosyringae TaxID=221518 RepID=A0A8T1VE72_9STRA|nr:hypothetical protein PHYPSEUDO_009984 [Phytophthora pseudosyringae]